MKVTLKVLVACLFTAAVAQSKSAAPRLHIYFVDVEGGQATLFVPPHGDSLLIDTGWPGQEARDAKRIATLAKRAGLRRIEYVLITHYHDDHVGGVPQLTALMPVGTIIDHGANRELDHGVTEQNYTAYLSAVTSSGAHHLVARAGEVLPIRGMKVQVVSADGKILRGSLSGGGQPNPFCAVTEQRAADTTENGRSVGVVLTFGRLRILDLGDLTWDREREMMCPVNRLGRIDLNIVSHHGWYQSSSPALIDAIHAEVAIMDNGASKGGSPATFKTLRAAPGLERLWQLHYAEGSGSANSSEQYLANPRGVDGNFIEVIANEQGHWKVRNPRMGFEESYAVHSAWSGWSGTGSIRPKSTP